MNTVYIGLGSNLSNPAKQIKAAVVELATLEDCQIDKVSALYYSRPMGPKDQPDYMNAVVSLKTKVSAIKLLDALQSIENNAGRVRKDNRWSARILDLDILLFGNQVINTARLTIPHYGMKSREFVLIPLHELAGDLVLPDGEKLIELIHNIDQNGLKIFDYSLQL
ncbi:MAG: 2-amino-4-hydroxy-6-hydroxymethyldihydropteridine diphosphokinase [Colwellia sp.]|nr:2-amino-4-hydroxy-6-hydroxymethyldihydropteridine diphosphokinase [Colwellia sp.]